MANRVILTGVKPTGALHLGNYVGAIKPMIKTLDTADKAYLFIADYHALNSVKDAKTLSDQTYQIAAAYMALGADPKKVILYKQSDIPEIFELSTILTSLTPKGMMNRSHAYKAAIDKNMADGKTGNDLDQGINMGLYTYPILMAADILIAGANIVPVGKDQIQHVEMARDMATTFNSTFGETIILPTHEVSKTAGIIPGLDGRKMSKSYNNTIPLFETSKKRRKMIMKIVTDSALPEDKKDPDQSTIFELYQSFATEAEINQLRQDFEAGGMGYGDAKQRLFEAVDRELAEPTEKYNQLLEDRIMIDDLLSDGAKRVREQSVKTLADVKKAIGL